ncbi:MAG: hypothetical protein RL343_289 [Actinomycetota bacterium]|jgi:hypothetical protein
MSEDLTQQVKEEVARVSALPLEEQPAAFASIRDQLERTLNSDEDSVSSNQSPLQQGE